MKRIITAISFLVVVHCSPVVEKRRYYPEEENPLRIRFLPRLDENGSLYYEDLTLAVPTTKASASDFTIYLYTQKNPDSPKVLAPNHVSSLTSHGFRPDRPSVFVVHGWNNDYTSNIFENIRPAILNAVNVNFFAIDWSDIASGSYVNIYLQMETLGDILGNFIYSIMTSHRVDVSNLYLIGHSLGAHVAGCAGARVKTLSGSLVKSIVGLDPAGPLFTINNIDNRLDSTDGSFVHVIHTSAGLLGFKSSIGHADYYPNGGVKQAGCGVDLVGSCAHSRSYIYYAESISRNFYSTNCDDYEDFLEGECSDNRQSLMGKFKTDTTASGDYYLNTNDDPPYAED